MRDAKGLLGNLVYRSGNLKKTIREEVSELKPYAKDLEVIHIRIDYPASSIFRKKKYYHIQRQEVRSRLDEWIFEHLISQDEYAAYLERYRPEKEKGAIEDIDQYIMNMHYRPRAIKILRRKKFFNLECWEKKRLCLEYLRRSNLYWKNGEEFRFDYRNPVESLFIRKNNGDREVIGIGGIGSSGQREMNTFLTAVFYLLSKKIKLPNFLLQYNSLNEFEYIGCKYRAILTPGFGGNFELGERLMKEIQEKGLYWR